MAIVLMGDGDRPSHEAMIAEHRLQDVPFALAPIVGINLGIGRLPHAVLIDPAGIIRAKGIVNSREHLESLLVAQETGYASMQDYLTGRAPGSAGRAARQPEDGRISA
jgi:methylamine dehydrogenase accessory protein MauD